MPDRPKACRFGLIAGLGAGAGIFYYRSLVNAHLAMGLSPSILSPEQPHETTVRTSRTRCPSAPAGVVRPSCHKQPLSFQPRLQLSLLIPCKLQNKTILRSLFSCSCTCSRSLFHNPHTIEFA